MLDGEGAGVFATRTPHRPNPIGLSLAMLETVDAAKGVVHLRGVDVIEVGHFVSASSLSCCLFLVHSRALAHLSLAGVQGTPILDIKPFCPYEALGSCDGADSGGSALRFPAWLTAEGRKVTPLRVVSISAAGS